MFRLTGAYATIGFIAGGLNYYSSRNASTHFSEDERIKKYSVTPEEFEFVRRFFATVDGVAWPVNVYDAVRYRDPLFPKLDIYRWDDLDRDMFVEFTVVIARGTRLVRQDKVSSEEWDSLSKEHSEIWKGLKKRLDEKRKARMA